MPEPAADVRPDAVAALAEAVRAEPDRPELWGRLATALLSAERPADALRAAGRAGAAGAGRRVGPPAGERRARPARPARGVGAGGGGGRTAGARTVVRPGAARPGAGGRGPAARRLGRGGPCGRAGSGRAPSAPGRRHGRGGAGGPAAGRDGVPARAHPRPRGRRGPRRPRPADRPWSRSRSRPGAAPGTRCRTVARDRGPAGDRVPTGAPARRRRVARVGCRVRRPAGRAGCRGRGAARIRSRRWIGRRVGRPGGRARSRPGCRLADRADPDPARPVAARDRLLRGPGVRPDRAVHRRRADRCRRRAGRLRLAALAGPASGRAGARQPAAADRPAGPDADCCSPWSAHSRWSRRCPRRCSARWPPPASPSSSPSPRRRPPRCCSVGAVRPGSAAAAGGSRSA